MIDLLFNFLLLIFWVRLFPVDRTAFYYNPYVAWINQASRIVLQRIRQYLPRLSQAQAALLVFGILLLLRAVLMPTKPFDGWRMTFGFERSLAGAGWLNRLIFSMASFGIVLFYVSVINGALRRYGRGSNMWAECLSFLSGPLDSWYASRRWAAIFGLGLAVSALLTVFAHSPEPEGWMRGIGLARFAWRMTVNTAAAAIGVLPLMQTMLFAVIIGSWITMLSPSEGLARVCREGVDYLTGPLRNYRIIIGQLDLTPLLALVIMMAAHNLGLRLLSPLYTL